jgi:hypothetical protein
MYLTRGIYYYLYIRLNRIFDLSSFNDNGPGLDPTLSEVLTFQYMSANPPATTRIPLLAAILMAAFGTSAHHTYTYGSTGLD